MSYIFSIAQLIKEKTPPSIIKNNHHTTNFYSLVMLSFCLARRSRSSKEDEFTSRSISWCNFDIILSISSGEKQQCRLRRSLSNFSKRLILYRVFVVLPQVFVVDVEWLAVDKFVVFTDVLSFCTIRFTLQLFSRLYSLIGLESCNARPL